MEKFILVTMPDGSIWKVRAERVIVDRATYYAQQDSAKGERPYEEIFDEEYTYGRGHNEEILDWAANNMNWSDVAHGAVKLPQPEKQLTPEQFQEGWVNGKKQIIEETLPAS